MMHVKSNWLTLLHRCRDRILNAESEVAHLIDVATDDIKNKKKREAVRKELEEEYGMNNLREMRKIALMRFAYGEQYLAEKSAERMCKLLDERETLIAQDFDNEVEKDE
jgi:transcriptional regulator NrdR family protein